MSLDMSDPVSGSSTGAFWVELIDGSDQHTSMANFFSNCCRIFLLFILRAIKTGHHGHLVSTLWAMQFVVWYHCYMFPKRQTSRSHWTVASFCICVLYLPDCRYSMNRTEFSGLKEDMNWFTLVYEGKSTLKVGGSGTGGLQELAEQLKDDEAMFGFLKVGAEDRKAVTSVSRLAETCEY